MSMQQERGAQKAVRKDAEYQQKNLAQKQCNVSVRKQPKIQLKMNAIILILLNIKHS